MTQRQGSLQEVPRGWSHRRAARPGQGCGSGAVPAGSRQGAAAARGPSSCGRVPCPGGKDERQGPAATAGRWHRARGSVASAASSAQRADPGLGFAAAFTHPVPSFPHPGAIPSGNSWDIEADCKDCVCKSLPRFSHCHSSLSSFPFLHPPNPAGLLEKLQSKCTSVFRPPITLRDFSRKGT